MASETLVRRTCDRCKKVIAEEAPTKKAPAPPGNAQDQKEAPTFILEVRRIQSDPAIAARGEAVTFDDLCTKCTGRLMDLVGQIRLDSKEGSDAPDKQGANEIVDTASKPKDNKGSKPAETKPASG